MNEPQYKIDEDVSTVHVEQGPAATVVVDISQPGLHVHQRHHADAELLREMRREERGRGKHMHLRVRLDIQA